MTTKRYVALLRGINVGGKNKVAMADLREAFEAAGYGAVRTYIQSGNVLFESDAPAKVAGGRHRGDARDALRGAPRGRRAVAPRSSAPSSTRPRRGSAPHPDTYHSDAMFLKAPLTAKQAMRIVELRDGVDQAWPGTGVLYFARLSAAPHEEPDEQDRRHARVPADDDPQLGHRDQAPGAARRACRALTLDAQAAQAMVR